MSRNLCKTECAFCGGVVRKTAPDRHIVESDCGVYFPSYRGMVVAEAACVDCEAPYLAWLDGSARPRPEGPYDVRYPNPVLDEGELTIRDLSHLHAFNDEPAEKDYPKWEMVRSRSPWPTCDLCGAPMVGTWDGAYCDRDRKHSDRCGDHEDCRTNIALSRACKRASLSNSDTKEGKINGNQG